VIRGDVTEMDVLLRVGAPEARVVVSTIRRREESAPLLAMAGDVPVVVRAFHQDDAEWIEERGGIAVSYSDAATADFLRWVPDELVDGNPGAGAASAPPE